MYRTLFDSVDEGFCLMEPVFDHNGLITDLVCRDANAALENVTGNSVTRGASVGKFIAGTLERWQDIIMRVLQTGDLETIETCNAESGRWFSIRYLFVGGPGTNLIAALFNDLTGLIRGWAWVFTSPNRLSRNTAGSYR